MFSKKKTECRVCGYRFTPERENIYTAEEPRSIADMLTKAPTRFSAVDCPICGCQIALAIRVPRVDISDNAERHDADALNIPASPYPDGDKGVMACPNCGSGEYLHNADENETKQDDVRDVVVCRAKKGDIWQLGVHRLMCGYSTNEEDVCNLCGGGSK